MMSTWQNNLQQESDGIAKEFVCLQRRYKATMSCLNTNETLVSYIITCNLQLSDPDLPLQWKENAHKVIITLPVDYPNTEPSINLPSLLMELRANSYEAFQKDIQKYAKNLIGNYSIRKLLTWIDNHILSYITDCNDEKSENKLMEVIPDKLLEQKDKNTQLHENPIKKDKIRRTCRYFRQNGACRDGEACKFAHEIRKQLNKYSDKHNLTEANRIDKETPNGPADNTKDKSQTLCKFYMRNSCKNGSSCRFSHTGASTKITEEQTVSKEESSSCPNTDEDIDSTRWSDDQQKALDQALEQYPALPKDASTIDQKQRWLNIANSVPNKTLLECIERFQYLCRIVQNEKLTGSEDETIQHPDTDIDLSAEIQDEGVDVEDNRVIPTADRITIYATFEEARKVLKDTITVKSTSANVSATVSLDELLMYQIGTVVAHSLSIVVRCLSCPLTFTTSLSLRRQSDTIRRWCPRCSVLHVIAINPILVHEKANLLAILRSENCIAVNILPSELLAACLNCNGEVLLTGVEPRRRNEQSCFACHTKLALNTSNIQLKTDTHVEVSDGKSTKGRKSSAIVTLPVGQPLPKNGTCEHYKHSYRWFRFQCCLGLFPCDICHDRSDCPKVNTGVRASRQLCGFCSSEQTTNLKEQKCGRCSTMLGGRRVQGSKSHWEGGEGCRNQLVMATGDRKKFSGLKKTQSHKSSRVGEEGKKRTMEKRAQMSKKT